MSIRVKDQMLSPQFKEIEQELSTQECRKFSTISAAEFNTPETKYRSTIGPNKMDLSKDTNQMHYRNGTAKFEDEQYKLCEEIKALFLKRQSLNPALFEPKILLKTENNPKELCIFYYHVQLILALKETMSPNRNLIFLIKLLLTKFILLINRAQKFIHISILIQINLFYSLKFIIPLLKLSMNWYSNQFLSIQKFNLKISQKIIFQTKKIKYFSQSNQLYNLDVQDVILCFNLFL